MRPLLRLAGRGTGFQPVFSRAECPCHTSAAPLTRGPPGFTLLELVAVVVVLAILAAAAMPRFGSSIAYHHVGAAARRVAVDLALARRHARSTSNAQTVTFTLQLARYELVDMQDLEQSKRDYIVDLSRPPYEAAINSADFGGETKLTFDGYGVPDNGGSIVVAAGRFSRTITVDPDSGEASVQ